MTRHQPRVLLVSPTHSHPPRQGNSARVLAFGRELKRRGYAVDFLYYKIDYWSGNTEIAMRAEWDRLYLVEPKPHLRQRHPDRWGVDDWCPPELTRLVRNLCLNNDYRAVVVNYVWLSAALDGVEGPLKVIDTHDLFGGRAEVARQSRMEPTWFFTSPQEESEGLDRADLVLAIQNEENEILKQRTQRQVMTIGHPVHASFRPLPAGDDQVFGYFASNNPWNVASLKSLDLALALAQAQSGMDVPWYLAGTICKAALNLHASPIIQGMVDAPHDFYDRVTCVLNPMLAGTGLKIKTVEALAHGRPLIGTEEAFRGLEQNHAYQSLTTIEDMVSAISDYASSKALRRELSAACARTYVSYMAATQKAYDDFAALIR